MHQCDECDSAHRIRRSFRCQVAKGDASACLPAAALLNSFSTTALLLVFGLWAPEVVADIAVVQAASLALFYAFSANARNLVLADVGPAGEAAAGALLKVRAVLMLPLAFATYLFG